MQNFKAQYNLNRWVLKKFTPLTVVMKGEISYIDQNHFLHQAVNMFFSAVKLGILTWGVYGIDSLLQPASSGQSMNCSFSHFRVGFTRESGRLPLEHTSCLSSQDLTNENKVCRHQGSRIRFWVTAEPDLGGWSRFALVVLWWHMWS